jgi:hypothetical protein
MASACAGAAKLLRERFRIAVRQQGYSTEPTLPDALRFQRERPAVIRTGQLNLFAENPG